MKKSVLFSTCVALTAALVSCGGQSGKKAKTADTAEAETKAVPAYTVIEKEQVDLASFLNERWKGMQPIAWGDTLRESEYTTWVYEGVCGLSDEKTAAQ